MKQTTVLAPVIDLKRGGSSEERQIADTPPYAAAALKVCLIQWARSSVLWVYTMYGMSKQLDFYLKMSVCDVNNKLQTSVWCCDPITYWTFNTPICRSHIVACVCICVCATGSCAEWFLFRRCADPVGGRVRSNVPQRLRESGKATQRGTTAPEGAGAAEGDWGERKVLPPLSLMIPCICVLVATTWDQAQNISGGLSSSYGIVILNI